MNQWVIFLNLAIPIIAEGILFVVEMAVASPGIFSVVLGWTYWLVLPGLLVVMNLILVLLGVEGSLLRSALWMFLGLLIGQAVGYLRWGITTERLWSPDAETIWVTKELIMFYTVVTGAFLLLMRGSQLLFQCLSKK